MKTRILIMMLSIIIGSTSCSHQLRLKDLVKNDKMEAKVSNNDASRRNAYFIYDHINNKITTLSEPPPDAVVAQTTELANKLKLEGKIDTEQTVKLAESIVELGQRTVAVNILRDALFRLNEMNVNNQNKEMDKISADLFDKILLAAKEISMADILRAKADKAQAEANLVEADVKKVNANIELIKVTNASDMLIKGFYSIINKQLDQSKSDFNKMYELFPTHFNIDEIKTILNQYNSKSIKDSDWKEIYKMIYPSKRWGMPSEIEERFKQLIK